MDLCDSSALAAWTQALIYALTLLVLYVQLKSLRAQTMIQTEALKEQVKNSKYSEYTRCKADFLQSMRQLTSDGSHDEIYSSLSKYGEPALGADWVKYSKEQKKVYAYFEILYELFVRVYVIRRNEVITDVEWGLWEVWINDVITHPVFKDVHNDSIGMYDKSFQDFITLKLENTKKPV